MFAKRLLIVVGLLAAAMALSACSLLSKPTPTLTATPTPIPPTVTPTATATSTRTATPTPIPPTATPTPIPPTPTPATYVGIDEPAIIEDVTMECVGGSTQKDTVSFTLVGADQIERIKSGEDEYIYPESGKKLLRLLATIEIQYACLDFEAVGRTLTLVCGEEQFETGYWGLLFTGKALL